MYVAVLTKQPLLMFNVSHCSSFRIYCRNEELQITLYTVKQLQMSLSFNSAMKNKEVLIVKYKILKHQLFGTEKVTVKVTTTLFAKQN